MAAAIVSIIAALEPEAAQVVSAIVAYEQKKKAANAPTTAALVTAAQLLAKIESTDAQIEANADGQLNPPPVA